MVKSGLLTPLLPRFLPRFLLRAVPGVLVLLLGLFVMSIAHASDVKITERTRYYAVSGPTIQALVKAMTKRGPYSQDHGRRAVGLADYKYRTRVTTLKKDGYCRVKKATITMQIIYFVPKLSRPKHLRARDHSKWRKIATMILRHERQHGRFYKRLAGELQRALLKMKPQKSCSKFKSIERKVRKELEKRDKSRNRRFDRAQYPPFNAGLAALAPNWRKYKYRRVS
jgi:predicted secreted Zn-dependent protease